MTTNPASTAAFAATPLPVAPPAPAAADALAHAAQIILPHLERGQRVDAPKLRGSMESAFGGSDADGAWDWKTAYDACEAATILFLRKFGPAMLARAASPAAMLPMLAKIAGLLPTHARRSEESQALQLHADRSGPGGQRRRRDHARRSRAGAFGRNRAARHSRRTRGRVARSQ